MMLSPIADLQICCFMLSNGAKNLIRDLTLRSPSAAVTSLLSHDSLLHCYHLMTRDLQDGCLMFAGQK